MSKMVAIDLGSSSIKGCLIDLETGRMGAIHHVPFPDREPEADARRFEVDLCQVLQRTTELLNGLLDVESDAEITSIWLCSQMGGLVLTDPHGTPLGHYLSWRDQRLLTDDQNGPSVWKSLQGRTTDDDLYRNGNELQPGSTVALLYWLQQQGRLPSSPILSMQLGDYVVAQLTQCMPRTQATMALGTLDLESGDRHRNWFERLGLGNVGWPALIIDAHEPVGFYQHRQKKIACYPAFGDHQSALAGVGLNEGDLSVNVSTGSQVSRVTRTLMRGPYQTRPFGDGRFLNTVTHLPAGRALNGLVDLLGELAKLEGHPLQDPWTHIEHAVAEVITKEGDRDHEETIDMELSFFTGPLGQSGRVSNLKLENLTIGHWFYAAYQSMARNYKMCADLVFPESDPQSILVSGGFAQRSLHLQRCIAQRFALPIRLMEGEEETLRGLSVFARRARCS